MKKRGTLLLCTLVLIVAFLLPVGAHAQEYASEWVQDASGNWSYYLEDGTKAKSGVFYIDGAYYGFDWWGQLYVDTEFGAYDEDGTYGHYCAKEDGTLYVNEWYMDDYGSYYYYGDAGRGLDGFATVDGVQYYFYSGCMARNESVTTDGVAYVADDDGHLTQLASGWNYVSEYYYYVKEDGSLAKGEVLLINGAYYAFDWGGQMYANCGFGWSFSDDGENYEYVYYWAREDGRLYVNEWYGNKYFGEGGRAPRGLATVDGILRYFGEWGEMARNTTVTVDGTIYIADEIGQLTQVVQGWNQLGEYYYYVKENGELASEEVLLIDGAYYGFDYDGQMYADEPFWVYDYTDDDDGVRVYYRAKADGKLYVNEWYVEESGERYYYSDGGAAKSGLVVVDGVPYMFYNTGLLMRDLVRSYDGVAYYADEEGNVTQLVKGWNQFGEHYAYVKETGECARREILCIDGAYYGFDTDGWRYTDSQFYLYIRDEDGNRAYDYFRAKEDGSLYVNEWYVATWGSKYYYGEGGRAAEGLMTVDGNVYCFYDAGQLACNRVVDADGKFYYADENGSLTQLVQGWNQLGDEYAYVKDDEWYAIEETLYIDGAYYAFDDNGLMYRGCQCNVWYSGEDDWGFFWYCAKENGMLYVNEWYKDDRGTYYYYGADGRAARGVVEIDGVLYGFNDEGMLLKKALLEADDGTCYYVDENGHASVMTAGLGWILIGDDYYYCGENGLYKETVVNIGGAYYGFDSYGRMYDNEDFGMDIYDENGYWLSWEYYRAQKGGALYVNQWYQDEYGSWFYYGEDGAGVEGVVTIGGVDYYFYEDGRMMTNKLFCIEENAYYIDGNGHAHELQIGWNYIDGYYYYMTEVGHVAEDEIVEIDGKLYYFRYNGRMHADGAIWISANFEDEYLHGYIYARPDGSLYREQLTWDYEDGYCYYDEFGIRVTTGLIQCDGNYYYLYYGEMLKNQVLSNGYQVYVFGADGVGYTAEGTQWVQGSEGEWLYVRNGIVVDGIVEIDGVEYLFDSGYLITNSYTWIYNRETDRYDPYLADANGHLITREGWHTVDGSYMYVQADGTLLEGLQTINGVRYFFTPAMAHDTVLDVDGKLYIAGASGALTEYVGDGIYEIYETLYLVVDGQIVRGQWISYNGKMFRAREDGSLYNDCIWVCDQNELYAFNKDGTLVTNGWYKTGYAMMYYADENGKLVTGWQTIDGKQYYFFEGGELHTGGYFYDGTGCYIIGPNGTAMNVTGQNGWIYFNGSYYYMEDGALYSYCYVEIDGKNYIFGSDGKMCADEFVYDYYVDGNGEVVTGWFVCGNDWYYANEDGELLNGLVEIDGVTYYLDDGRMLTGLQMYLDSDGDDLMVYLVDCGKNGVVVSKTLMDGELVYANGEVIYVKNGEAYTGWLGNRYFSDGAMLSNTILGTGSDAYYLKMDGNCAYGFVAIEAMDADVWVYANADGKLAYNEWKLIGGYWYYFNAYVMVSGGNFEIDGNLCQFDESGHYLGIVEPEEPDFTGAADGWYYWDGEYYYIHAGEAVCDEMLLINGSWYYFDDAGIMVTDEMVYSEENSCDYYFGSSGARVETTGWVLINGNYYYFNQNHSIRFDLFMDNGTWYYTYYYERYLNGKWDCGSVMAQDTYQVINGKLYYFDHSGAGTEINIENGWYNADGEWYYFRNGAMVSGEQIIGGTAYYFSNYRMITNGFGQSNDYQKVYYLDGNGLVVRTPGWHQLAKGWIYINEDGSVCTSGVYLIDGAEYAFLGAYWVN